MDDDIDAEQPQQPHSQSIESALDTLQHMTTQDFERELQRRRDAGGQQSMPARVLAFLTLYMSAAEQERAALEQRTTADKARL